MGIMTLTFFIGVDDKSVQRYNNFCIYAKLLCFLYKKSPKLTFRTSFLLTSNGFLSLCFLCGSLALSLCLSGSSFLSSLLSCSSELSGSSGTLLSDSSSFRLVGLYLLSEESLSGSTLLVSLSSADLTILSIFFCFPSVKTLLCLFSTECALSDTTVEVLHEQYTLVRKDGAYGVSRLCTYAYPVQSAIEVKDHSCRVSVGVERTDTLDNSAVTRRAAVCYYDVVESVVFVTMTSQTNLCFVDLGLRESVSGLILMTCFLHEKACKGTTFLRYDQIFLQNSFKKDDF